MNGEKEVVAGSTEEAGAQEVGTENTDQFLDEVKKRGAKNVIEENERKSQEIKELKEKLNAVVEKPKSDPAVVGRAGVYPPKIQAFFDKSVKSGVNSEWVESMCDAMLTTAIEAAEARATHHISEFSKKTERIVEKYQRETLNDAVSQLGKDKKYKFVVEKYSDQIKKRIKEQFKPEFYDNEEVVKTVAAQIFMENSAVEAAEGEEAKEVVGESAPASKAVAGKPVSDEILQRFADEMGVDIANPEIKKKVREAYIQREKALKNRE